MEFNAIMQNLKRKVYHPIYLLQGDEPFFLIRFQTTLKKTCSLKPKRDLTRRFFTGKIQMKERLLKQHYGFR